MCRHSSGSQGQSCEHWALRGCMGARRNQLGHQVCGRRMLRISTSSLTFTEHLPCVRNHCAPTSLQGTTVPPSSYNEHFLLFWDKFTFLLCVLRCMYVVCGCMYHSRCNLDNLLLECGSWGSSRFSAKHLYPLNHLNSPSSSSNYDHCSFTCPAFLNMV